MRDIFTQLLRGYEETTNEDVQNVLVELGDPIDLAGKYGGSKRYLIGPKLLDAYLSIVKIVLVSISVAMSVVFVIETIFDPASVLGHFIGFLVSIIHVSAQAFAWITVGFAIAEYKGDFPKEFKLSNNDSWKPSDLPPIPDHNKQIKRSEAITGIIFSVVALVVVTFSNHLFGVPFFENDELVTIIPFLNYEVIDRFFPIIYLLVAVGILKECIKLVIGKWTKKLALYNLMLNGVRLGLAMILLKDQVILNPHFLQDILQFSGLSPDDTGYVVVNSFWDQALLWVLIVFIISVVIDTVSGFYKAYKK